MRIQTAKDNFTGGENIKVYRHLHLQDELEHRHEFFEICYIYSGSGYQHVNDKTSYVQRGDLIIIGSEDVHAFEPDGSIGVLNCLIAPQFLSDELSGKFGAYDILSLSLFQDFNIIHDVVPVVSFTGKRFFEIENILDSMEREFSQKETGYITALKGLLQFLFVIIFRQLRESDNNRVAPSFEKIAPEVLKYVEENYDRKISLTELAQNSFYNASYFSKIFKESFGKSLMQYINELRINEAVRLLEMGNLSVEEVAARVGYSDRKQFYKVFKKRTGKTPGEFKDKKDKK